MKILESWNGFSWEAVELPLLKIFITWQGYEQSDAARRLVFLGAGKWTRKPAEDLLSHSYSDFKIWKWHYIGNIKIAEKYPLCPFFFFFFFLFFLNYFSKVFLNAYRQISISVSLSLLFSMVLWCNYAISYIKKY